MNTFSLIFCERPSYDSIPSALIGPDIFESEDAAYNSLLDYVVPSLQHDPSLDFDEHCQIEGIENPLNGIGDDLTDVYGFNIEIKKMMCDYFFKTKDNECEKDAFYLISKHSDNSAIQEKDAEKSVDYVCPSCKSTNIGTEANVTWSVKDQKWVLDTVNFGAGFCAGCQSSYIREFEEVEVKPDPHR